MVAQNNLARLIDLANESSSKSRRDLLRGITDVFFIEPARTDDEREAYDAVFCALSSEMEEAVRVDLSQRFADNPTAPHRLVKNLAMDAAAVARPVLERSTVLSDEDLLDVVRTGGQEHLRAVSRRPTVPERVSDVIVDRADEVTLDVLVRNDGAVLSREVSEALVSRAEQSPALGEALVERRTLPLDLLNALYFTVENSVRERILQRNQAMDPAAVEAALKVSRQRLTPQYTALPSDYNEAEKYVSDLSAQGDLTPSALVRMVRARQETRFLVALGYTVGVDYPISRRIVSRRDLDALAILCKASAFDQSLFLTLAVLIAEPENGIARSTEYAELYRKLTHEVAKRTIRFWKIRQHAEGVDAHNTS
jgi:uncharacterized protein (DUF2336 family)